jgi:hypothetical protein
MRNKKKRNPHKSGVVSLSLLLLPTFPHAICTTRIVGRGKKKKEKKEPANTSHHLSHVSSRGAGW